MTGEVVVSEEAVRLRPDRLRAAWWAGIGLVATGLSAWAFSASTWSLFYAVLCTACALATTVFTLQLLAPDTWTLTVDRDGVHGHVAAFRVDEPFQGLRAVQLGSLAGEPVLVLRGRGRRRLLLPVGCDLAGLRRVLQDVRLEASHAS